MYELIFLKLTEPDKIDAGRHSKITCGPIYLPTLTHLVDAVVAEFSRTFVGYWILVDVNEKH